MTDEQAAEMLANLKDIRELLISLSQTQERIARSLQMLVGSVQHGRSRG